MRGSMTITTCTEDADAMSNDTISLKRQENKTVRSLLSAEGRSGLLPFGPGPQQVGPQDDGDVGGRHLVYSLLLRQQGQELDQIADRERQNQVVTGGNYHHEKANSGWMWV